MNSSCIKVQIGTNILKTEKCARRRNNLIDYAQCFNQNFRTHARGDTHPSLKLSDFDLKNSEWS